MYVQEEVSEQEDGKMLIKCFRTRELVQKQARFERDLSQVEDQNQGVGAARATRRPIFTPKEKS